MRAFDDIYQQVLGRIGSATILESMLPLAWGEQQLIDRGDNNYLSTLSRRVFRAGLKHSLVDAKWTAFEAAFFNFSPLRVAMMSDDELDVLMANRKLIRHWNKLKSVRSNAIFFVELIETHGSIGAWLANWPADDIVGLWLYLKKNGTYLGGNSAPSFLRMVGKDTMLLTDDVSVALMAQGIVDKKPTSQRDLNAVQNAFNYWHEQSGRPYCQLSRLLSMTVNY